MKKIKLYLFILLSVSILNNCMFLSEENIFDYYMSYTIDGHIYEFDEFNGDFYCSSSYYIDSWYCQWQSFDGLETVELYFNSSSENFEYILYDYHDNYFTDYSTNNFTILTDEIDEFDNYISGHFNGLIISEKYNSFTNETIIYDDDNYVSGDFFLPIETY